MSRTVILHYHLFKNAGTSVDHILQQNFPERWVTAEFPPNGGDNSALIADWIRDTPDAVAFSTHTGLGPVPEIDGVTVISLILLRDPIRRIRSAYRFERNQDADTWGAELAKAHDLEGYVRARLDRMGDRQCRNFQTHRLASLVPGHGPELDRAIAGLDAVSVFGLVEEFDAALQRVAARIRGAFPGFFWEPVQANRTSPPPETPGDRRIDALLTEANADDLALWTAARQRLGQPADSAQRTG